MSVYRTQAQYDSAEPDEGAEIPDCEECGETAEVDRSSCGCLVWRCTADGCGSSGTIESCRDCARGE